MQLLSSIGTRVASAGALAAIVLTSPGCIEDTDCGICDPDNLVLESISGINYQSDKIHILSPNCEGGDCPAPLDKGTYFIEEIIRCQDTEVAQASVDPEEFCKLSPLVTAFGIEFVFNNLLDPTSIELVRKRPDNPQLFEVYDWKPDVLQVEGPITRFNGDYNKGAREAADTITRLVNLSCIDNLRAEGQDFSSTSYDDPANNPCNQIGPNGQPRKLFENGVVKAARGIWTQSGSSCSTPDEGPDTCCSYCEFLLSTKVERYGVTAEGQVRSPNPGTTDANGDPYADAIVCREGESDGIPVDKYAACSGFVPFVDRTHEEQSWRYAWCDNGNCEPTEHKLPLFDKLRETHPDQRPAGLENLSAKCDSTSSCSDVHGLSGTECVGTHSDTGSACLMDAYDDDTCDTGVCRPQWTAICTDNVDTTGGERAFCADRRFATSGTAACMTTTGAVENSGIYGNPSGNPQGGQNNGAGITFGCDADGTNCTGQGAGGGPLSQTDWNENGRLTAAEACQAPIYGPPQAGTAIGFECDPYYQSNLRDLPNYQRDENLPDPTRRCRCPNSGSFESNRADLEEDNCLEVVENGCFDNSGDLIEGREGQYAVKFIARAGGIIYDPAIKGFDWRPADLGGIPRADIENCAENNTDRLVAPLNRHDGWRAADTFTPESFEDYDRAMCSGQEYRVVFNEPGTDNPAVVSDKVGNTLENKSVYTFETSQFHLQPGSGFPTDNLRIGACDDFSIRFSNKYDSSPENLAKLQLFRVACTGTGADRECELTSPDPRCDQANPPEGACCEIAPVAGGAFCEETKADLEGSANACAAPCLTVDIENQFIGEVSVEIDPIEFGQYLNVDQTYRMLAPTAGSLADATSNPDIYSGVFWDVCGMPLVAENADPYAYDFKIDTPKCKEDKDNDGIPFSCDNADDAFNPLQEDIDNDGIGDVVDLCPVAGGDANNSADGDNDGVGNECDTCRQTLTQYNLNAEAATVPDYMQVRNIPDQTDTDEDGIGDVCDNCVLTANCESFGTGNAQRPYEVGDAIAFGDDDVCQRDNDQSMIGDACEGAMINDFAAGPVGLTDDDDFDQDGIANINDKCPRQPLTAGAPVSCTFETAEADCGEDRSCSPEGVCNHLDTDGDGVGNRCDTCAFDANPMQTMEGGAQDDDPDGDFVGEDCEVGVEKGCGDRKNARPFGFYSVVAAGNCCTTQLIVADEAAVEASADSDTPLTLGDLLLAGTCTDAADLSTCLPLKASHPELPNARDEAGNLILEIPVRTTEFCSDDQQDANLCAQLPSSLEVTPGILTPPPGCDVALEDAGISALDNLLTPLTDDDFADQSNPLDALWQTQCFLPQVDQDYDGLGDPCDKCPFAFDPSDAEFVDGTGRLWPNDGAACNGDFLADNICELEEMQTGETGDTDDMGSSGGAGGSSGG